MDLINEQHVALLQVGQQGRQVAGLFNGRAAGNADLHPHLLGHNAGQGGFAQARRAVKQHMVHRFAPAAGCFQINAKVLLHLFLAHIVLQGAGAKVVFFPIGAGFLWAY